MRLIKVFYCAPIIPNRSSAFSLSLICQISLTPPVVHSRNYYY